MGPRLRLKKSSPQAGLELTIARSVGQRLTHGATGAPRTIEVLLYIEPRNVTLNDVKISMALHNLTDAERKWFSA